MKYTKDYILYEYIIHNDATGDIRDILALNRPAGMKVLQAAQQLKNDQDAMDRLTQREWGGSPKRPSPKSATFNTGPWVEAQNARMNLWRLRFFDELLAEYRFIHAFFQAENRYVLLAVVEKADFGEIHDERFNYELKHPISKRIVRAYEKLVEDVW